MSLTNVKKLSDQLRSARNAGGPDERKVRFQNALDTASKVFPTFKRALNSYEEDFRKGNVESPFDVNYVMTFRRFFDQVPGLFSALDFVMNARYGKGTA